MSNNEPTSQSSQFTVTHFSDFTFDASSFTKQLLNREYTDSQRCLMERMKSVHHFNNDVLNIVKLIIYDWNIDKAVKHYQIDNFCIDHFLNECNDETCPSNFEHKYNFYKIWKQQIIEGFQLVKLLLEYILYTNKRPNSSHLYSCYGNVTRQFIKTKEDGLKCEKCFLKAILLNSQNYGAHFGYGILLQDKKYQMYNFDKALKHFEIACSVDSDPNVALFCQSYAQALWRHAQTKDDYEKVLFYAKKSISHDSNLAQSWYLASHALYSLQKYQQCVEYHEKYLTLSNNCKSARKKLKYVIAKLLLLAMSKRAINTNIAKDIDDDEKLQYTDVQEDDHDKEENNLDKLDKLFEDYVESNGKMLPFVDQSIKYLCYFNEMQVDSNNDILKTHKEIEYLVQGYVRQNTDNVYDLSELVKIIIKYFGPPGNETLFHVCLSPSIANNDQQRELQMGHLYRTIIFNHPLYDIKSLKSKNVQFKVVKSKMCDYWKKYFNRFKLGFGFAIGIIEIDLNEKIAFNCDDDKDNINSNPILLSKNMNLFLTDLVALYSKAVKMLGAAHFIFDTNTNCFVCVKSYLFDNREKEYTLSNLETGIQKRRRRHARIGVGQTCTFTIDRNGDLLSHLLEIKDFNHDNEEDNKRDNDNSIQDIDNNNRKLYFGTQKVDNKNFDNHQADSLNNFCWLPVISCVGCNCSTCTDSPLVLNLIC